MRKLTIKIRYLIPFLFGAIFILVIVVAVVYRNFNLAKSINNDAINLSHKQNLIVEVSPEIDANDILIKWYGPTESPVLFINKSNWGKIPYHEGNCCFSVFFKNEMIRKVGHFVGSKHGYHNYLFRFFTHGKNVDFTFKAIGPDSSTYKLWNKLYPLANGRSIPVQTNSPLKSHTDSAKIENTIEFSLQPNDLERLLTPQLETNIKKIDCTINDHGHKIKTLKTRGQTSLWYRRKCYNVTLKDSANFKEGEGTRRKMKSFSLLSLSMDHCYFRNRIAFALLKEVKLMNIFCSYAEVKMNGETQGIYLLIEEPKKHLSDSLKATFLIRRRYEYSSFVDKSLSGRSKEFFKKLIGYNNIDYNSEKALSSKNTRQFLGQYKMIYKVIHEKKGIELYHSLAEIMDIEEYMRIMAFNFVLCNRDYTDEQFFYINGQNKSNRFNIMPWDFDDIFGTSPHEGWLLRNKRINDKLIFSGENELDLAIATDSILYTKYLGALSDVINRLDTSKLQIIYQNTYNELYPFFNDKEIIKQSRFDEFTEEYNLSGLEAELNGTYWFLLQRINSIRSNLKMMEDFIHAENSFRKITR